MDPLRIPLDDDVILARARRQPAQRPAAPVPTAPAAAPTYTDDSVGKQPDPAVIADPALRERPVQASDITAIVDQTMAQQGPSSEPAIPAGHPPGTTELEEQNAAQAAREAAADRLSRPAFRMKRPDEATVPGEQTGKTVAKNIFEVPIKGVYGGIHGAFQEMLNLAYPVAKWLDENRALWDSPMVMGKANPRTSSKLSDKAPEIPLAAADPETPTGKAVKSVSQFLTGFAIGGKILKGAGVVAEGFAGGMLKGAFSDFAAFGAHEERLANFLDEVPALKGPVTEFMKAKKEDEGELEGRLKRAVEGVFVGGVAGVVGVGLLRGLKYLKSMRAAKAAESGRAASEETEEQLARGMQQPREASPPTSTLGDETAPAVIEMPKSGIKSIDAGVPDDALARSLSRKGLTPLAESEKLGKSYHLNFAAIKGPDDVKRVISDVQRAFWDDIDAIRGGVKSDTKLYAEADATNAFDALIKRRDGAPLADKEVVAVRRVWEAGASKLFELAQNAVRYPTVENEFALRDMLEKFKWIQGEVMGARAESGRAQRAWGVPIGGGNAERLMAMENLLNTYGGRDGAQEIAKQLTLLSMIPGGMSKLPVIAERSVFAKTVDGLKEIFINNILGSVNTQAVNVLGNVAGNIQLLAETAAAARYSQLFGSGQVKIGEATAALYSDRQGTREGMRLFWMALKEGESQFAVKTSKTGDQGIAQSISGKNWNASYKPAFTAQMFKINPDDTMGLAVDYLGQMLSHGKAVDALGAYLNIPTRVLTATDDFFKQWAYRRAVNQLAFRKATQEVEDGVITEAQKGARLNELATNPPPDLHLESINAAVYATYTNRAGKVSAAINDFERKLSSNDSGIASQLLGLGLRYKVPFRNTVSNLGQFAFERTPLAPLMQRYKEAIERGGADADIARSKMAVGSFVLSGLVDLAMDGYITGPGPSYKDSGDKGTLETMKESGWQPWALYFPSKDGKGKGTYVSFQRTDPIGKYLGMASTIAETLKRGELDDSKKESLLKLFTAAVVMFGSQELDRGYMSGVADIFAALGSDDPARQLIERPLASTLVPNYVTDIRKMTDPYQRYVEDLQSELMNRIPFLSNKLPVKRDRFGEPMKYESNIPGPIKVTDWNPAPFRREALKEDFNFMPLQKTIQVAGSRFNLNNEQFSRFKEIYGTLKPSEIGVGRFDVARVASKGEPRSGEDFVKKYGDTNVLQLLNDIVTGNHAASEHYKTLSGGRNGDKDKYVTSAISARFARAAAAKLFEEFPDLRKRVVRTKVILPADIRFPNDPSPP